MNIPRLSVLPIIFMYWLLHQTFTEWDVRKADVIPCILPSSRQSAARLPWMPCSRSRLSMSRISSHRDSILITWPSALTMTVRLCILNLMRLIGVLKRLRVSCREASVHRWRRSRKNKRRCAKTPFLKKLPLLQTTVAGVNLPI